MAETFPYPVEGCEHTPFKTPQALGSHISIGHPGVAREKGTAREVPIVEVDLATAELVGGKRTDIMREASYRACDKAALKQFKALATSF